MTSKTTQRQEKRADVCSLSCRVLYYEIMGRAAFGNGSGIRRGMPSAASFAVPAR